MIFIIMECKKFKKIENVALYIVLKRFTSSDDDVGVGMEPDRAPEES